MDETDASQWRPEPEPQNALERLLLKAARDAAFHGPMFRKLWESDVHALIPYHPEMLGTHEMQSGDMLNLCQFHDERGAFLPVFTSEEVARCSVSKLPNVEQFAIVTLPAEALFQLAVDMDCRVLINGMSKARMDMTADAVRRFAKGEFTRLSPSGGHNEELTLLPMPSEQMKPAFRHGLLAFCDRRPVPLGVYVFNPLDTTTGLANTRDIRIILWLRGTDETFYNDFSLMIGRLAPSDVTVQCAVVTPDKPDVMTFLQKHQPVWPVLPE